MKNYWTLRKDSILIFFDRHELLLLLLLYIKSSNIMKKILSEGTRIIGEQTTKQIHVIQIIQH